MIGSETVTLFRFRPPDQVHHRQASPNEQRVCSTREPKSLSECSVLERSSEWNNWNYWNGWNVWNRFLPVERLERLEQAPLVEQLEPLEQASLRCVQSDRGPRSAGQTENSFRQSQTILRDLNHHSFPLLIRQFDRLERSAAVKRLELL
jgi:hypothetical protein